MKFTFPGASPQELLQGMGSARTTWEYRWASRAVIAQGILGAALMAWFWSSLPPQVPLWYSRPWGEDRLASPWFLLVPLILAIVVYIVNIAAVSRSAAAHPMFARVLLLTSLFISVLSAVMIVRIITLVT